MALYAIADLHLSLGTDKPMNVFSGWDDHVTRLEENWRRLVREEDTVVVAGDISWGMSFEEAKSDFAFLHSLPGSKLLLKGNHDYWWNTRKKMDTFFAENGWDSLRIVHNDAVTVGNVAVCGTRGWFYDAEADADKKVLLREVSRLKTSVQAGRKLGAEPIVFLHYPPIYGGIVCEEMMRTLRDEQITECYYGHIHGSGLKKAFCGSYSGVRFTLISSDGVEFCPVLVRE